MRPKEIQRIISSTNAQDASKEIYKLYLEELLAESHCIYDRFCVGSAVEFAEYIDQYNNELEEKLRQLNEDKRSSSTGSTTSS